MKVKTLLQLLRGLLFLLSSLLYRVSLACLALLSPSPLCPFDSKMRRVRWGRNNLNSPASACLAAAKSALLVPFAILSAPVPYHSYRNHSVSLFWTKFRTSPDVLGRRSLGKCRLGFDHDLHPDFQSSASLASFAF